MVRAYVLVTLEPTKTKTAIEKMASRSGIKNCAMVTGRYDAVIEVEAEDIKRLSESVVSTIRSVEGVRRTETLVVYS